MLQTVAPMGAGSLVGALSGGLLVGLIAVSLLKALLGVVLIVSALRMFRRPRANLIQPAAAAAGRGTAPPAR
jgi:uncharacterized membrane protein YfcA